MKFLFRLKFPAGEEPSGKKKKKKKKAKDNSDSEQTFLSWTTHSRPANSSLKYSDVWLYM